MRELLAVHVGLVDLRRILRNVGGNLNDVARYANVTGTLAAETAEVQGMVARVVGRVDAALVDLRAVMALARSSDGAGRGRRRCPGRDRSGAAVSARTGGLVGPPDRGDCANADRA